MVYIELHISIFLFDIFNWHKLIYALTNKRINADKITCGVKLEGGIYSPMPPNTSSILALDVKGRENVYNID